MKIENLIIKYLTNEATSTDLDSLSKWIESQENERFFNDYVKTYYEVTMAMNKPDVDNIKKNLLQKIKKDKNPFYRYRVNSILKYAAILTIILGLGHLIKSSFSEAPHEVVQKNILIPKEESITIRLDNGEVQTINPEEEGKELRDSEGNLIGNVNKSQLVYGKNKKVETLVYNTLNIPNGKRFDIILSDGTHIFLNSGSTLRYPVKFIEGSTRDVFLTGEAYFDVMEDKAHPFVVHVDDMEVNVLGTTFNVSDYDEDPNINTVLVEGSVELYNKETNNSTLLKPGFKAAWDKSSNKISIENVDTRVYTAWIDGKLIFRNATFRQIRNMLERYYNVAIHNDNEDLDRQLFDATFDIETIDQILETFSKSYAIEYSIINNEVMIH